MLGTELERVNGESLNLLAGETIFREGDTGRQMFVLLEGTVEVYVQSDGARIPVAKFSPGDFFGEMSLLEGLPRSGTAVARRAVGLSRWMKRLFASWRPRTARSRGGS
ncbi:cyclic nucleotide-binding domain-containing protein [Cohnella cholangitidis]|uniref:Cyclic nucleotide-binding domain-containing protein n=1 Tax=Cohnella cholangitidis TaxID=2598458 RepID=A0A7G5BZY3_9BACL|nr:cyclic nucleotide-binding domain-containing protein [Cohnella cholangitidis]QMV42517.1 cyclic nucleotide-binding domain-containing protein [Cohnella cholangitidis]